MARKSAVVHHLDPCTSKRMLPMSLQEHMHTDEEIRFLLDGSGAAICLAAVDKRCYFEHALPPSRQRCCSR